MIGDARIMAPTRSSVEDGTVIKVLMGSWTDANSGNSRPAKEQKRTVTAQDATVANFSLDSVTTSDAMIVANATEASVEEIDKTSGMCRRDEPTVPARVKSNANTQKFTKRDTADTPLAAIFEFIFSSANALKDDGTSVPSSSCCLMATSAIVNPDIKCMANAKMKIHVDAPIPNGAAVSGNTKQLAPTVLPVINNAADNTGGIKLLVDVVLSRNADCSSIAIADNFEDDSSTSRFFRFFEVEPSSFVNELCSVVDVCIPVFFAKVLDKNTLLFARTEKAVTDGALIVA
mmetsp:Transcript_268/g.427  ORF Transcript_268/g.427 Transcript_268/m.427 type:complete len:289 (+) Transcript_268:858-1724(+)